MNLKELIEWNIEQVKMCNRLADAALASANDKRSSKHTRMWHLHEADVYRDKAERHCECVNALRGINNG